MGRPDQEERGGEAGKAFEIAPGPLAARGAAWRAPGFAGGRRDSNPPASARLGQDVRDSPGFASLAARRRCRQRLVPADLIDRAAVRRGRQNPSRTAKPRLASPQITRPANAAGNTRTEPLAPRTAPNASNKMPIASQSASPAIRAIIRPPAGRLANAKHAPLTNRAAAMATSEVTVAPAMHIPAKNGDTYRCRNVTRMLINFTPHRSQIRQPSLRATYP